MWTFHSILATSEAFASRPFTTIPTLKGVLESMKEKRKGRVWRGEIILHDAKKEVCEQTLQSPCVQDGMKTYIPYGNLVELEDLIRKIQLLDGDEKKLDKIWIYHVGYFVQ